MSAGWEEVLLVTEKIFWLLLRKEKEKYRTCIWHLNIFWLRNQSIAISYRCSQFFFFFALQFYFFSLHDNCYSILASRAYPNDHIFQFKGAKCNAVSLNSKSRSDSGSLARQTSQSINIERHGIHMHFFPFHRLYHSDFGDLPISLWLILGSDDLMLPSNQGKGTWSFNKSTIPS